MSSSACSPGSRFTSPQDMIHERIREYSPKPVHTCVYTHGHADHVFGIMAFDDEAKEKGWRRPRVCSPCDAV